MAQGGGSLPEKLPEAIKKIQGPYLTSRGVSLILGSMKMKIVTKRFGKEDPIQDSRILQRTMNRLRGTALVPKGVYRFKTFEEADQWMTQMMAATHARLSLKTS